MSATAGQELLRQDTLRGIALMTFAMAAFAVEDMFIKFLAEHLPLGQILILIGLGGTVGFAAIARARGIRLMTPALLTRPVLLRTLGETLGTVFFVLALANLPLATVASVLQAAPLVVTLGGALFLGAPVGWRRWTAIGVGFVGVLMILRPGLGSFEPLSLLALGATLCLALRDLATRAVPPHIPSLVLTTSGFAAVTLAGLALLPFGAGPIWPAPQSWAWLGGALLSGMLAYTAITAAMRLGDLASVTPFRYTRLLFSIVIGVLAFGEYPDAMTLSGAAVILVAGLYTLARSRRVDPLP